MGAITAPAPGGSTGAGSRSAPSDAGPAATCSSSPLVDAGEVFHEGCHPPARTCAPRAGEHSGGRAQKASRLPLPSSTSSRLLPAVRWGGRARHEGSTMSLTTRRRRPAPLLASSTWCRRSVALSRMTASPAGTATHGAPAGDLFRAGAVTEDGTLVAVGIAGRLCRTSPRRRIHRRGDPGLQRRHTQCDVDAVRRAHSRRLGTRLHPRHHLHPVRGVWGEPARSRVAELSPSGARSTWLECAVPPPG